MKQARKNASPARSTGSSGFSKYLLIAVVLAIAGYLTYEFAIKEEEKVSKPVVIDPREKIKSVKEPQFVKEGELEFIRKGGRQVIRKIDVELAENDRERETGMMYRKSMDDGKGMLFIFPKDEFQSFWMKNTIIPLDIIYVNSSKEIVKIYRSTTPFSENSLPSERPAMYVVEVAGGFTERYGIGEGDLISFSK